MIASTNRLCARLKLAPSSLAVRIQSDRSVLIDATVKDRLFVSVAPERVLRIGDMLDDPGAPAPACRVGVQDVFPRWSRLIDRAVRGKAVLVFPERFVELDVMRHFARGGVGDNAVAANGRLGARRARAVCVTASCSASEPELECERAIRKAAGSCRTGLAY